MGLLMRFTEVAAAAPADILAPAQLGQACKDKDIMADHMLQLHIPHIMVAEVAEQVVLVETLAPVLLDQVV